MRIAVKKAPEVKKTFGVLLTKRSILDLPWNTTINL